MLWDGAIVVLSVVDFKLGGRGRGCLRGGTEPSYVLEIKDRTKNNQLVRNLRALWIGGVSAQVLLHYLESVVWLGKKTKTLKIHDTSSQ